MHLGIGASLIVVTAILSARLVHSAAPNPHQLFALQSAAALADAAATTNSTAYAIDHEEHAPPRPRGGMYKRHRRPRMGGLKHGHHREERAVREQAEEELLHQRSLEAGLERERIRRTEAASGLDKRGNGGVWTGVSSYYLFALYDSDRYAVLDAIKSGGFSVVRIFIAGVGANNKGSNSRAVNDGEVPVSGVILIAGSDLFESAQSNRMRSAFMTTLFWVSWINSWSIARRGVRPTPAIRFGLAHLLIRCPHQPSSCSSRYRTATPSGSGLPTATPPTSTLSSPARPAPKKSPTRPSFIPTSGPSRCLRNGLRIS